jgi:hypothetical protein
MIEGGIILCISFLAVIIYKLDELADRLDCLEDILLAEEDDPDPDVGEPDPEYHKIITLRREAK